MIQPGTRTRSLPPELISRILDYLELHDLFAPLATSRTWRRVALDHPTYWRDVRFTSTSDNSINLFLSRLTHARQRKISVEVNAIRPCRRISDDVLPAIGARLSHIRALWTAVHHEQAFDLSAALCRPAQALETLQIFIVTPGRVPLAILPADMFSGDAPKLTFLGLRDVGLSDSAYQAFSSVTRTDFGFTRAKSFYVVPQLFAVFPRMRRLGLHSGDLDVPEDLVFPAEMPAGVEAVVCMMNSRSLEFMTGVIPYHAIPSARVGDTADDTVDFLLRQLPGEVTMDVTDLRHVRRELFDITVTSTETKFARTFAQSARHYLMGVHPPIAFLRDFDFAERLVALTIPDVLWGFIAHHLLPLPNLKELSLGLESPSLPVLGSKWSISCSKLRSLRLSASTIDPLYVSTDRLATFVAISLADLPLSPVPALELERVILEGARDVLRPHLSLPGESPASRKPPPVFGKSSGTMRAREPLGCKAAHAQDSKPLCALNL
ncbi:hypothetical protein AURDEDRAFT_161420 [Auricularia subglabra TFB-10046 SS5]|nr:hypothetical protein AURDEDRAFT_161420 [Auricularia subglabra TFB-10046 SS5]